MNIIITKPFYHPLEAGEITEAAAADCLIEILEILLCNNSSPDTNGICSEKFQHFYVVFSGDEILSVNGHSTQGLSHSEAISIFKGIRSGKVTIHVARREPTNTRYSFPSFILSILVLVLFWILLGSGKIGQ